ncbi:WGR domain-containing protein [Sulfurimonas sp. C5]|uniref:WGR domain-containing protein n=1 Tax=Sulfurimonas sp. C5 TaxID=3036947 RepID=UPI002454E85B|nr:WGR domain-containing protein [Sulfurimonas sp. C5]MDH4944696.1 WGR domain-containing protein [Sulfurimonas sp. C5]
MVLFKSSNEKVYYYKINIYQTLFGDYLIQREYGGIQNHNPTNTIKSYAPSKKEALCKVLDIVVDKKQLGYLKRV